MDDLSLPKDQLQTALNELALLNRLSLAALPIAKAIKKIALERNKQRISICDIACGSGDVLIEVVRILGKAGITATASGLDFNLNSVAIAQQRSSKSNTPFEFHTKNCLIDDLPNDADFFICSLFLHHLERADAVSLLSQMRGKCKVGVVVSDLRRSRLGFLLVWLATNSFCKSKIVKDDGLCSVNAAFTLEEAKILAAEAGLSDAQCSANWPERFIMAWSKS